MDRWYKLTQQLQGFPTLFWGYNVGDADVLQALNPDTINQRTQEEKWIILRNTDEATQEYFRALGFSLIIANFVHARLFV